MRQQNFSWITDDRLKMQAWISAPDSPKGVVALVHGLGEHSSRYQHMAEFLNNAGYAFVSFDLRGHGISGGIRGHASSYEMMMDDIHHLLQEAVAHFPNIPLFLYGHSMGGGMVMYYAISREPTINGLIVTSPSLAPAFPIPPIKMAMAKIMVKFAPMITLNNGLDINGLSRDPQIVENYKTDPLVTSQVSARLGMDIINYGEWVFSHAQELDLPTLLMQGSKDWIVNPEITSRFAEKLDGKLTYKIWGDFYHELHNEPEKLEVLSFIRNWLDNQISSG